MKEEYEEAIAKIYAPGIYVDSKNGIDGNKVGINGTRKNPLKTEKAAKELSKRLNKPANTYIDCVVK